MSDVMSPTSTDQALEMLTAALGYLATADATEMTDEEQARCLKVLERATAITAAARTSTLSAFTSGKGYSSDAQYSAKTWLVYKTGVTKGAAASHTAWMRRAQEHPAMFAAMAAGDGVGVGGPAPVPVPRLSPARLRLPGPPRQAQEERRRDQRYGLCPVVPVPSPDRHPHMGLEPGPEPRRDDDRVEQGPDQGPPQPRAPGPAGVTSPGPVSPA
jgi:hypothetical protein